MTYTVTVGGVELDPTEVEINFDASGAPHVTAPIRVKRPTGAVYSALDPRTAPRVVLTRDGRTCDLSVRDRFVALADVVELQLASDEAILMSYKAGVDDRTPRALEGSLRDVIDYVLDTVIPGAELEASPAHDVDVTAYWELSNLLINPSIANSTTGWGAGTGTSAIDFSTAVGGFAGPSCIRWTADSTGISRVSSTSISVSGGQDYSASAYVLAAASSDGDEVRLGVRFYDEEWEPIATHLGDAVTVNTSGWQRVKVLGVTAPEAAAAARIFGENVAGTSGRNTYLDAGMFYEGIEEVEYFDGSNTPTGYTTEWTEATHLSPSVRIPITPRDPESTVWRAGVSALEFLHPLFQAAGLRLVCDEQRRWTLRDEDYKADGSVSAVYAQNLREGSERISLDAGLYFDARLTRYRWTRNGRDYVQDDYYELNDPPQVVDFVEIEAPYPGPGRSEYAVRRAQSRGREVDITVATDMSVSAEQNVNVTLQDGVAQIGVAQTVQFIWSRTVDEMRIRTRTREVPAGSIDAADGTINAAIGTINDA